MGLPSWRHIQQRWAMDSRFRQPVFACAYGGCWAGWLSWIVYVHWAEVRHPYHWVTLGLLLAAFVSGAAWVAEWIANGRGFWSRGAVIGWAGLLATPFCWLVLALLPLGAADPGRSAGLSTRSPLQVAHERIWTEAALRLTRPHRSTGERLVLAARSDFDAAAVVSAADEWLAELEEVWGRPIEREQPLVWSRAALWRGWGRDLPGFALPPRGANANGAEHARWTQDDRRDLAAAYLQACLDRTTPLPAFLQRGAVRWTLWSAAHHSRQRGIPQPFWWGRATGATGSFGPVDALPSLLASAWWARNVALHGSLAEVVAADGRGIAAWELEDYGAVLIHYLVERHGQAQVLEFLRTCQTNSLDSDLQRVWQTNLAQLDLDLAAYLQEQLGTPSPISGQLADIGVARPSDQGSWQQFVTSHQRRVQDFYRYSHVIELEMIEPFAYQPNDEATEGSAQRKPLEPTRAQVWFDRRRMAARVQRPRETITWVASVPVSFSLRKKAGDPTNGQLQVGSGRRYYNEISSEMIATIGGLIQIISPWLADFPQAGAQYGGWQLLSIEPLPEELPSGDGATVPTAAVEPPSRRHRLELERRNARPGYLRRALVDVSLDDGRVFTSWLGSENGMGVPFAVRRKIEYGEESTALPRSMAEESLDEHDVASPFGQLTISRWERVEKIPDEVFQADTWGIELPERVAGGSTPGRFPWSAACGVLWPITGLLVGGCCTVMARRQARVAATGDLAQPVKLEDKKR